MVFLYSQYYYGCNVVAGRTAAADSGNYPVTEGGDAGGYVGLMRSGVISNGQSYDIKLVRAMRSAGGYAGSMQTGGLADVGQAEVDLFGLDLSADLGTLVSAVGQVFVPAVMPAVMSARLTALRFGATRMSETPPERDAAFTGSVMCAESTPPAALQVWQRRHPSRRSTQTLHKRVCFRQF